MDVEAGSAADSVAEPESWRLLTPASEEAEARKLAFIRVSTLSIETAEAAGLIATVGQSSIQSPATSQPNQKEREHFE